MFSVGQEVEVILHMGFARYEFLFTPCSTSQVATTDSSGLKSWRDGGEKVAIACLEGQKLDSDAVF